MTDKELLIAFRKSRSSEHLEILVNRYKALVAQSLAVQISDEATIKHLTEIVFQTFSRRIRKISKHTYLPGWFVRTATYSVTHWERKNQKELADQSDPRRGLLALTDLPLHLSDALIALAIHDGSVEAAALATSRSQRRICRWINKGQKKLSKRATKRGLREEPAAEVLSLSFLGQDYQPASTWATDSIVSQALDHQNLASFTKGTLRTWSWFFWRRRLKRVAIGVGSLLLLLGSLAMFVAWAWQTGYLMAWMISFGAQQALKEAPELALPPKPWTGTGLKYESIEDRKDLFGPTNIWNVDFTFTKEEWEGITPKKIKPINLFDEDGKIVLRNPNAKRSGLAGVLGIEFEWTEADLTFGGQSFTNIATRYRGNGTYVNSLYGKKQSIKIDLNRNVKGQKVKGIDRLNFNNLVEDATFMHDSLGYALFRASGIAAPRTAYAWITVEVLGVHERQPKGFYLMLENVGQRFAKDRFGDSKTPIFKPVTPYLFRYLGENWSNYAAIYDLKTEATEEQKRQVIEFANSLTNDTDSVFAERVSRFVDLDQFSRYLASIVLIASYDGFLTNGQNFYMYLDPDTNLFGFIPWDLDHAWGDFPFIGSASDRDQASIWHPWSGDHRFLERVMKVEAFRELYRAQLETLLATEFNSETLAPRIDSIAENIAPLVELDNPFRYRRFQEAVGDDWGAPPPTTEGAIRPVNAIKRFIAARSASVRDQLDGKSEGVIPKNFMRPNANE